MPSELATCIRGPPADNLPAWPWHVNYTRSDTHQMAIESLLNPSPPAAAPIFQDLLPISKLLIPPKTSTPNSTYRCIACYQICRKRASLQYHIGKVHLHIYPVRHLWSSLGKIRLQDLPRSNLTLRPNHCHHSLAFVVGWFALGRSTYCASAIIAAANGAPLLTQTVYFFVHWKRASVPSDPESIRNSQNLRISLLTA
jgi:hypothetical protein